MQSWQSVFFVLDPVLSRLTAGRENMMFAAAVARCFARVENSKTLSFTCTLLSTEQIISWTGATGRWKN